MLRDCDSVGGLGLCLRVFTQDQKSDALCGRYRTHRALGNTQRHRNSKEVDVNSLDTGLDTQ